jgi:hypothetical protein
MIVVLLPCERECACPLLLPAVPSATPFFVFLTHWLLCRVDCVSRLAGCIKYMDDMPATRSVGVRLLGRILGKNLTLLLQAVSGRNARGEPCSDEEIAFSASLLASLSLDDETVETLMFQRHVYREADVGIVPDNACPETIVSLIKSVHIPDAVVSMMDVAR